MAAAAALVRPKPAAAEPGSPARGRALSFHPFLRRFGARTLLGPRANCLSLSRDFSSLQHESAHPGGRVRHAAAPADALLPETAGGVLQQAHGAASNRGAGGGVGHRGHFGSGVSAPGHGRLSAATAEEVGHQNHRLAGRGADGHRRAAQAGAAAAGRRRAVFRAEFRRHLPVPVGGHDRRPQETRRHGHHPAHQSGRAEQVRHRAVRCRQHARERLSGKTDRVGGQHGQRRRVPVVTVGAAAHRDAPHQHRTRGVPGAGRRRSAVCARTDRALGGCGPAEGLSDRYVHALAGHAIGERRAAGHRADVHRQRAGGPVGPHRQRLPRRSGCGHRGELRDRARCAPQAEHVAAGVPRQVAHLDRLVDHRLGLHHRIVLVNGGIVLPHKSVSEPILQPTVVL
eukprot:ctg_949.g224